MRGLTLTVLVISFVLFGACAAPQEAVSLPESPIPSNYTTYTDDEGVFSISYPPDWEVNLSLIEDVKFQEYMKQSFELTESETSTMSSMLLFLAGIPTGKGGYSPNVSVAVLPSAGKEPKLNNVVDEIIRQEKDFHAEYTVFLRIQTTVDGSEAVIKEIEAYRPGMERAHQLQMITHEDKIIWVVTCTTRPAEFVKYEDDFYHISRSLRILKR